MSLFWAILSVLARPVHLLAIEVATVDSDVFQLFISAPDTADPLDREMLMPAQWPQAPQPTPF